MNFRRAQVVYVPRESLLGAPRDVRGIADLEIRVHPDEHLGGGYLIGSVAYAPLEAKTS